VTRGISLLVHGPAKSGKTSLADTAPAPRLLLDVESGGSDFTSSRKIYWDPSGRSTLEGVVKGKPPEDDGTWETCVVYIREPGDIDKAYEWLNSGQHPFRSAILDSITEDQVQAIDKVTGGGEMDLKKWGKVLQEVGGIARKFRNLVTHPVKPLDAVVIIAATHKRDGTGNWTPFVQGQLRVSLPYLYDMLAYLGEPIRNADGSITRRLLTGPQPGYDAGGRFEALLPHVIDNPNITDMLSVIRKSLTDAA
jgi:hypothetical protein